MGKRRCYWSRLCRTDRARYGLLMLLLAGGLFLGAQPAAAQSGGNACLKEATGLNNPSCTANDVRIGRMALIPGQLTSCDPNSPDPITVTLEATIESGPDRYAIGLWVNETGGSAKSDPTGTCFRDYLHPVDSTTSCNQIGGPYYNVDDDNCGDVYASNTNPCGNAVTGPCTSGGGTCLFTTMQFTVSILCRDTNDDGLADVEQCTSWDNQVVGTCLSELDTNPSTGSKCNCGSVPIVGLHTGCMVDADCDDSNACTTDTCTVVGNVGTCANTPVVCNDGNACTTDSCDPATGCTTTPVVCDDGNACTTDSCDPATGCTTTPVVCDDSDACTTDSCDPATGCVHTNICGLEPLIAPTDTTCSDYLNGIAATLSQIQYSTKYNKVNQVNPGVFFFYDEVTVSGGPANVTVTQVNTEGWPDINPNNDTQIFMYDLNCNHVFQGTFSNGTVTFTGVTDGTYVIGILYAAGSVKGTDASALPTVTYTFTSPSGTANIGYVPK